MQTKRTYLFFSLPKHDDAYTSTPWQLARELALLHEVIYVDHPYNFWEALKLFSTPKIQWRFKSYFKFSVKELEGVNVLPTPFVWPTHFLPIGKLHRFFTNWNEKIVAKRVNSFLKQRDIKSVVYVNSFEFYFPTFQNKLRTRINTSVYHCIDPMIKKYTLKHGPALQQQAASNAEMIITTAPALMKQFEGCDFSTVNLVPNAANFHLFNQALHENIQVHQAIPSGRKTIGYLGNIERRIDFHLLLQLMERLSDFQLVMAGPIELKYVSEEVLHHPRIKFIGAVAHQDAPSVLKGFDVAIIPFRIDEVSEGIYPLKLFEYLATGKPVVTTNFNPSVLGELSQVVEIAQSPNHFVELVEQAAQSDTLLNREKRIAMARVNTWKERAELFDQLVQLNVA
ncbi:MAG: glycosyltransferase [Cyclobacteriaceae bacterium]|jgi:teichuronic acid biosynthesis glycosyltransferase TuaH|nr:glycosyltransferase [Flammeovirgaceae bacterium]